MTITRIEPVSLAKVFGILYAALGLIYGLFLAAFGSLFMGIMSSVDPTMSSAGGMGMGVGLISVITLPIFFGFTGFVGGLITAFLYNLVAGRVGGVEVQVDSETESVLF